MERPSIKIARVIARLNVGGPSLHVASLSARLAARGFDTRLFAGEVSPGEREMTEALEREGIIPRRVPGLGRAIRTASDVRAFGALVHEFRTFKPDIVHTHTAKAGTLGRLAAWVSGAPVVVHTFHGHVFHGYFPRPIAQAFVAIEKTLALGTDRIVTISPRQLFDLTARYGIVRPEKIVLIPLGFDLRPFEEVGAHTGHLRRELGIGDEPIISTVGRLVPIKDHPLLLRAFRELNDGRAHLCIVGGGELEADLRRLAMELGIAGRTHFLGFRSDLVAVLADTDVVALTSLNEGTPVALIEALAAGCMPVAVSVGGVADVLEDGRWGVLAHDRTAKSVAEALRIGLRLQSPRPSEQVQAARRYVSEKYGVERLVADHEALYRDLLRGVRSRPA